MFVGILFVNCKKGGEKRERERRYYRVTK